MPIRDLRNTTEISDIAHKMQEPIYIAKNGYSDLVLMSSELFDRFAKMNHIDQAIYESEKEIADGADSINLNEAFERLNKNTMDKYEVKLDPKTYRDLDDIFSKLMKLQRLSILLPSNTKDTMYNQKISHIFILPQFRRIGIAVSC